MIDAIPMHDPPQLAQPLEQIDQVRRRKHRRGVTTGTLVIGALIFLDNGQTPCRIIALHPEPLCIPEAGQ